MNELTCVSLFLFLFLFLFCRVFSDGGNFSTDEVDEYRKKLVSTFAGISLLSNGLSLSFVVLNLHCHCMTLSGAYGEQDRLV